MYWDGLGKFELVGKKDADASRNRVFAMNVPGWKSQFWAINDSSYERERAARWGGGGWGYGFEDRKEDNSDTGNENGTDDDTNDDDDEDEEEEDSGED